MILYKKFDVNQTKILDAEKRLEEAKKELENAKKEAETAKKQVEEKSETVEDIEKEINKEKGTFMPYEDFVRDLEEYADELVRKWNKTKEDKPVFLIGIKGNEGHQYYPAFNGRANPESYDEVWHWRKTEKTSFLKEDDPNYKSFKKVLEDQHIIVDTRLFAEEGYWTKEEAINRMVTLAYVFFYRDLEDFNNAATKTKELIEKHYYELRKKAEKRLCPEIIEILYEKYFEHT